jgi:protein gp37
MNKTSIEWCDFTWNPLVGCKYNCYYCYAIKLNAFRKFIPCWSEPVYYFDRLNEKVPGMPKIRNGIVKHISPDKPAVFVVSMGDLFGCWVNPHFIQKVIDYSVDHPQANFLFLTKNPLRYSEFVFPDNCFLGATVERRSYMDKIKELKRSNWNGNNLFISVEPLLTTMVDVDFSGIDFLIVGADSSKKPVIPAKDWIKSIKHPVIYYKENILKYL